METNELSKEQLMQNLPSYLQESGVSEQQETSLSIYREDVLTPQNILKQVKKLKMAFPTLPTAFYDILEERIRANNFGDKRLNDAIANVIDTCPYPTPAIANVISFDKRVKLYTYSELVAKVNQGYDMKDFKKLNDKKLWISISDAETYNIK